MALLSIPLLSISTNLSKTQRPTLIRRMVVARKQIQCHNCEHIYPAYNEMPNEFEDCPKCKEPNTWFFQGLVDGETRYRIYEAIKNHEANKGE